MVAPPGVTNAAGSRQAVEMQQKGSTATMRRAGLVSPEQSALSIPTGPIGVTVLTATTFVVLLMCILDGSEDPNLVFRVAPVPPLLSHHHQLVPAKTCVVPGTGLCSPPFHGIIH